MLSYCLRHYTVQPHKITQWNEFIYDTPKRRCRPVNYSAYFNPPANPNDNLKNNKHKGNLSHKAKSKVTAAMHALRFISPMKSVYSSKDKLWFKFRLNFITLTLCAPQMHSDSFIVKNMLRPFLDYLEYNYKMNSYVWKAEPQSNGNIHFHITTNIFIHYKHVNGKWHQLLRKFGYVQEYNKHHPGEMPPSANIQSVKSDKKICGYIAGEICADKKNKKYLSLFCPISPGEFEIENYNWQQAADMSWNEIKRPIKSRLWGCSINLTQCMLKFNSENESILADLKQLKRNDFWKVYSHDYGAAYYMKFSTPYKFTGELKMWWNHIINETRKFENKKRKIILNPN